MAGLPIILNLEGRRSVIVGGGGVALRRAKSLLDAGAQVTVIAPQLHEELSGMRITIHRRAYQAGDLTDAFLVVIATDDPTANESAAEEARLVGAIVNRADDPEEGDLIVPAHGSIGPITIAVATDGISARAAAVIRDQLIATIDHDWVTLLETVRPYRARLIERIADACRRGKLLRALTDPAAMRTLKTGGPAALEKYCHELITQAGA